MTTISPDGGDGGPADRYQRARTWESSRRHELRDTVSALKTDPDVSPWGTREAEEWYCALETYTDALEALLGAVSAELD